MGASGAISGSAVVRRIEEHLGDQEALLRAVSEFVKSMKAATGGPS
jgi:tryptophan synthase alpha chain